MNPLQRHYVNHHALCTGVYGFRATDWYPGPLTLDHTGINNPASHQDVQLASGTWFAAPVGDWWVEQNYQGDGWGLTLVLTHANSFGQIVFEHMNEVVNTLAVGSRVHEGDWLGASGGIPGQAPGVSEQYSDGAHLHIACTIGIKERIYQHYGKAAFVGGVSQWDYNQYLQPGGNSFRRGKSR